MKLNIFAAINVKANIYSDWELTAAIPLKIFSYFEITSLQNRECRADFYKCVGLLTEHYFAACNNIIYTEPNY